MSFANSSQVCSDAQTQMTSGFVTTAPLRCTQAATAGVSWLDCRAQYCGMYQQAVQYISYRGGPYFYGGDVCRPLLNFNYSLCMSDYRDADAFCSCLCPMIPLLTAGSLCQEEIMAFILIGRKSPELMQTNPMSQYCSTFMCKWFETIGDPSPFYPITGVPGQCHDVFLPYRHDFCARLVTESPYSDTPWVNSTGADNVLECVDGTRAQVDPNSSDTMAICSSHEYRWKCPKNFPVMCEGTDCVGLSDSCCVTDVSQCPSGERQGSCVLVHLLPEWIGKLTPAALLAMQSISTTMDPYQEFLSRKIPTPTNAPTTSQILLLYLPLLIALVIVVGVVCACASCLCLCNSHVRSVRRAVLGAPRMLAIYKTDPVSVFIATGNVPKSKERDAPLPPLRPQADIEAEKADLAVNTEMQVAWEAAEMKGLRFLAPAPGEPPPVAEGLLKAAIAHVRARGLQDRGPNPSLIKRGETWLQTLKTECRLVAAMEDAKIELERQQRRTAVAVTTTTWMLGNVEATRVQGEVRTEGWHRLESLTEAIKESRLGGASDTLISRAEDVVQQIVARTPELPADRCVLCPDGEGIKLLPKGQKRAVWPVDGASYHYDSQTHQAGDFDSPPRASLGQVAVDSARPVCAEWAKIGKCQAGRRCPWRHVKPQACDSIREWIIFGDA